MIDLNEALKIAREKKHGIAHCIEYENAFVFFSADTGVFMEGGGSGPCAVMKDNGWAVSYPYFLTHNPGKELREFDV